MNPLERAIILKKELDALRPLKKEDELRIMQKFRLDWNYHSNNLEGNTLTYGETKALILHGITAQGKPLKDHFEITGHDEALKWVEELVKQDRPLSESFIRELHRLILKEPYEVDAITPEGKPTRKKIKVGEYKTTPNHVETKTGEILRFATPEETPALMGDLIEWYRNSMEDTEPVLLATEFHYRFIRIHPFDDGNGRTARILMNFILMSKGYPPVIIKTDDKASYFAALQQADAGMIAAFAEYIAENLVRSLEIMIKGANGEDIEEPDDLDKELAILEKKLEAVSTSATVTLNRNVLENIFEEVLISFTKLFEEKSRRLNKYYLSLRKRVKLDSIEENFNTASDLKGVGEGMLNKYSGGLPTQVGLTFYYNTFKQVEFDEFDYQCSVGVTFKKTKYTFETDDEVIERPYSEMLTDDELLRVAKSIVKNHMNFIEQKIEKRKK